MKFEDSEFSKLKYYKLEMPFGVFYFLESLFIAEINEGVHFDWDLIKSVMDELVNFYDAGTQIGYISNRVNSYSINPQTWDKVHKTYDMISICAIIPYRHISLMNVSIEKQFFSAIRIKACYTLKEAIEWGVENSKN